MSAPLLEIRDLRVSVRGDEGEARILDFVNLTVARGEAVGVVGESGCGKSTLLKAVLGLLPRGAEVETGVIRFDGEDLLQLRPEDFARRIRGRAVGFVPQDPFQSFNPVFTVGRQMLEILRWTGLPGEPPRTIWTSRERERARAALIEALRAVQLPDPEGALDRYPHQFSGGQRQRILIAGALAARPQLILADEPTTALDVTTQMQILSLLRRLARDFDVGLVFVSHDFGAVAQLCDRVAVMYGGQTVETGPADAVIADPRHPYAAALLACHPDGERPLVGIPGLVSSALAPPPGCRFNPRCVLAVEACRNERPPLRTVAPGRLVACVHAEAS
ncbi:ABC transporter ATP-binding protein [Rubrimonas sp.]|uniref:ABC transporter ATP-binding protein n=1 Tax=Rubrimonas sp. TaxID=2036015 RepID=UPI002FDE4051